MTSDSLIPSAAPFDPDLLERDFAARFVDERNVAGIATRARWTRSNGASSMRSCSTVEACR